ncbi:MAG: lipid-A-disaccharide synthase [Planctomycetales bacterium]|nr:lipid-A-disaccharide synthase [Planctomycetales bacterium]
MNKTIFFSVGEPSGDQHAARLIRSIAKRASGVKCRGFGGEQMRGAGCAVDLDLTEHAVVGILEVLPKLRDFFRFADQAEAIFAGGGIDAVVLVDFPGFNWHIAKRAKKYGIPVYYFCPPQLWAWAAWRIKKMKATVDHVLAVLPIEEEFFSGHGIPTTFVGHPFFDAVGEAQLDRALMDRLELSASHGRTVAVLPGSRGHEVHRNWPIMLDAIGQLSARYPEVRFAVAAYREKHLAFCKAEFDRAGVDLPIDFYMGATSEIIHHADCAMMVSGSVSLELMARQTPAAVLYRVGRFLYAFGKCVVKVDSMTLPNLMQKSADVAIGRGCKSADERVFPEIVSVGNPAKASSFLVETLGRMLGDSEYLAGKRRQLGYLNEQYAKPGAADRAADKVIDLLSQSAAVESTQRAA